MGTTTTKDYSLLIGGAFVVPTRTMTTTNPATGAVWATIPDATPEEVDAAVRAAREAFAPSSEWRRMTPSDRGRCLLRLADLVDEHADELGVIESRDNGKLLRETSAQAHALGRWYRFYGGMADKLEGTVPATDMPSVVNFVTREPLGVIAAVAPWNSPLMLMTWKLAPALAAGNTVVAKPSEVTSASLLELAPLFAEAGFPPGVVNVVAGRGEEAGAALSSHPDIDAVSFTGGPVAGRQIAHAAAESLIPVTLELGGKSANVVLADAPFKAAIAGVLAGIFAASGQTCIAGSRLLVDREIAAAFLDELLSRVADIRLGDPTDADTHMGPVATAAQLETLERVVQGAVEEGATVRAGGRRASEARLNGGLFFEPTVLVDVEPTMRVAQEETFGPVLTVMTFDGEEEAIALANGTRYGLAAGVWSRDIKRAHRVARALRAGTVWVNTYRAVSPTSPSGGMGLSGFGRENGIEAIRAYQQTKSVWIETSETIQDPFVVRMS